MSELPGEVDVLAAAADRKDTAALELSVAQLDASRFRGFELSAVAVHCKISGLARSRRSS